MIQNEQKIIRVLIADDNLIVREGLRSLLESSVGLACLGTATDETSLLRLVGELQPDIVLMDMQMPGMDGMKVIAHMHHTWHNIAVVILVTHYDDELLLSGLRAGACGYLLKDTNRETLLYVMRTAARGETLLQPELLRSLLARTQVHVTARRVSKHRYTGTITRREHEVLTRVACGERNKEIAARLGISEPTVKSHLVSVYAKLGVDSRASAVACAIENGLISLRLL